jgi:hypothetical protein
MAKRHSPKKSSGSTDAVRSEALQAVKDLKKLGGVVQQEDGKVIEIALKTKRSASALPLLSRFPHLRTLSLGNLPILADDYRVLSTLSGLEELYIAYCGPMGGTGLRAVGALADLKRLGLSFANESDVMPKSVSHLRRLIKLEWLGSARISTSGADFGFLTDLHRLKYLSLYGVKSVGLVMTHVGRCEHLEDLALCETDIKDEELQLLRGMAELRILNLGSAKGITGRAVTALLPFRNLEQLWLHGTSFDDAGMTDLGRLKHLKRLDLRWCPITDAGLARYQPPDTLKELVVYASNVTARGVKQFMAAYPQIGVYSGWNPEELDALAEQATESVPKGVAPVGITEPPDTERDKRIRRLTAALEAKHKGQGEPLTTKKALSKFSRIMKFKIGKEQAALSAIWDRFKSFCELAIDCAGELFQIDDISNESLSLAFTRFWYEPGIVSDELYMAECRVDVEVDKGQWDVPHCQFGSLSEFVEKVESNKKFRDLAPAVVSKLELYAGKG